ncbi:hypothetical protein ACK36G_18635 [Aeromonas veronii]|uniref:hypothetical protein n=1 Tax=Aeromonas caviae TaxID=648 RepID=UPI002E7B6E46|nr:hypothetical protein [Aeromonas caviae]MEE1913646.1 hypothetical protein [Aeromonas caviae]
MHDQEELEVTVTALALTGFKAEQGRALPGYQERLANLSAEREALVRAMDSDPSGRKLPDYLRHSDSTDRALIALPHPARAMNLSRLDIVASLMFGAQVVTDIWGMTQVGASMGEIMFYVETNDSPEMEAFRRAAESNPSQNRNLSATLHPIYHAFTSGSIMELRNSVVESLLNTDVSGDVPCRFLRSPMSSCYIEFGDKDMEMPLFVDNVETGRHVLQGVYIIEREVSNMATIEGSAANLGINPDEPARIMDLMFVGRAKSNPLDDAVFHLSLYLQDDDMPVQEMIERHMRHYTSKELASYRGLFSTSLGHRPNVSEVDVYSGYLMWMTKVMLYLNIASFRREVMNERTELLKRISALGPKKAAKQARKINTVYDRVVIGPAAEVENHLQGTAGDGERRHNRPHFRRGHIRMQAYGEQKSLRKPIFIQPLFVNKSGFGETPAAKRYDVK